MTRKEWWKCRIFVWLQRSSWWCKSSNLCLWKLRRTVDNDESHEVYWVGEPAGCVQLLATRACLKLRFIHKGQRKELLVWCPKKRTSLKCALRMFSSSFSLSLTLTLCLSLYGSRCNCKGLLGGGRRSKFQISLATFFLNHTQIHCLYRISHHIVCRRQKPKWDALKKETSGEHICTIALEYIHSTSLNTYIPQRLCLNAY